MKNLPRRRGGTEKAQLGDRTIAKETEPLKRGGTGEAEEIAGFWLLALGIWPKKPKPKSRVQQHR